MVPLPLAKLACTVSLPIPSASRGVPSTDTVRAKPTCTEIVSPASYVSPLVGLLATETALTAGIVERPSTLWPSALEIA